MSHVKMDGLPLTTNRIKASDRPCDPANRGREAYIEAAWRRCVEEYRLDPDRLPTQEHIGGAALKHRREALALFELVGRGEMQRLFEQLKQQALSSMASPRFVLMLADADATILEVFTDASDTATAEFSRTANMRPGFLWDERHVGANGPGTCVHDGLPRLVHREDHFFSCNRNMSCSASPVWGSNGELLGAVDISFIDCLDNRSSQVVTSTLVNMSARIIEHLHFSQQYRDSLVMHFHERSEFIGLAYDSLLALDESGRVRAVDSTVPGKLGFSSHAALVGRSIADLFDISVDRLLAHAATEPYTAWPIAYGHNGHGYASLHPPQAGTKARSASGRSPAERTRQRPPSPVLRRTAPSLRAIAGEDPAMQKNVWRAEHVMNKDIHILLLGETGTGKDTFARAIHQASDRRDEPFIVVSCAAIPESLIESELFGYEPGAFTGARAGGMRGKALAAHRGTLFLDEIGDMPLSIQARLLRLLEEKEVVPLGSTTSIPVDIRVISATHKDLEALVASGEFRTDLYYRLNGIPLTMPALRLRADRASLIERVACEENAGVPIDIAPDAREILLAYNWPGNIRELRNALRTAIAFAENRRLEASHLPGALARGADNAPLIRVVEDCNELPNPTEHAQILNELERQHWRITSTANVLGISRNTLYRKLRRYGLLPSVTSQD
jgi:transcriptional regulator of acetoin/glycerol metabolism